MSGDVTSHVYSVSARPVKDCAGRLAATVAVQAKALFASPLPSGDGIRKNT